MKMIKKVLAAVLAMAMVIGMMAMSTFAASKSVTVTVKWDGLAAGGDMTLWIATSDEAGEWGINITEAGEWPGDKMTDNGDGTWSITYDVPTDYVNVIPCYTDANGSKVQTVDLTAASCATGNILVTITGVIDDEEDENYGKYKATAEAVGDTGAGDSSVMVYVVAAVVAVAAAVTVVCKRRSVEA